MSSAARPQQARLYLVPKPHATTSKFSVDSQRRRRYRHSACLHIVTRHRPRVRRSPTAPTSELCLIEPIDHSPNTCCHDEVLSEDITVSRSAARRPTSRYHRRHPAGDRTAKVQPFIEHRPCTFPTPRPDYPPPPSPLALLWDPYGVREAASRGHEPDRKRHRALLSEASNVFALFSPVIRPPVALPLTALRPWHARLRISTCAVPRPY